MSENYDSKLVSQDSGAVEKGDSNDSRTPPVWDDVEPAGQEPSSLQVDGVDHSNGVLLTGDDSAENGPSDVRAIDDGGKEHVFVDCLDELIVSDNREAMAIPDTQQRLEENNDMQDTRVLESDNGTRVHDRMDELVHLLAMLEKIVAVKEGSALEYKEESDAFMKELANLCPHGRKAGNFARTQDLSPAHFAVVRW